MSSVEVLIFVLHVPGYKFCSFLEPKYLSVITYYLNALGVMRFALPFLIFSFTRIQFQMLTTFALAPSRINGFVVFLAFLAFLASLAFPAFSLSPYSLAIGN